MKHDECIRTSGAGIGLEIAHDHRHRLVARLVLDAVDDDPPLAVAGRQLGLGQAGDELLAAAAIGDQHLDREDRQAELPGDRMEPLAAGDADAVEDLTEHAGRGQARRAGPDRRSPRYARPGGARPLRCATSGNMCPGRTRSLGLVAGSMIARTVRARSSALMPVWHERWSTGTVNGRAERGAVLLDHRVQIELLRPLGHDRHAELAPPVRDHERDRLGRHAIGRRDEVALVLALIVVDDDHHAPLGHGFQRVFDFREFGGHDLVSIQLSTRPFTASHSRHPAPVRLDLSSRADDSGVECPLPVRPTGELRSRGRDAMASRRPMPGPGCYQWNTVAWFGGQIGCTAWMLVGAAMLACGSPRGRGCLGGLLPRRQRGRFLRCGRGAAGSDRFRRSRLVSSCAESAACSPWSRSTCSGPDSG